MFMPRALAKTVDAIARQTVGKDWSLYAALLDHWQEIVGPEYAKVTTPVKITFPYQPQQPRRCDGMLYVRLPKGLAMEFTFRTEQIKARINSYFGYNAIARISFDAVFMEMPEESIVAAQPSPEALSEIKNTAKTIEDDGLRQALEQFGEAVLKNPNARS